MIAVVTTMAMLPITAWMIDMAARRRSFIFDFVIVGITIMSFVIVVRAWMVAFFGNVHESFAMPTLIGSAIGIILVRVLAGRWQAPQRRAVAYNARQSKYSGYTRRTI
ncbi:MAG TPA: hypothetical protein PL187_23800 [Caldilinea sp.]|nr:hypothetical protein [Caldilinea sp.]